MSDEKAIETKNGEATKVDGIIPNCKNNFWVELKYNNLADNMKIDITYYLRVSEWYSVLGTRSDDDFEILSGKDFYSFSAKMLVSRIVEDSEVTIPVGDLSHPCKSNNQTSLAAAHLIVAAEKFLNELPEVKASEFISSGYEDKLKEYLKKCPRSVPRDKNETAPDGKKKMYMDEFHPMPTGNDA